MLSHYIPHKSHCHLCAHAIMIRLLVSMVIHTCWQSCLQHKLTRTWEEMLQILPFNESDHCFSMWLLTWKEFKTSGTSCQGGKLQFYLNYLLKASDPLYKENIMYVVVKISKMFSDPDCDLQCFFPQGVAYHVIQSEGRRVEKEKKYMLKWHPLLSSYRNQWLNNLRLKSTILHKCLTYVHDLT